MSFQLNRLPVTVFVVATLLATASPAVITGEYRAINLHRVAPSAVEGADMEVFSRTGAAGSDYFCAAAQYAERKLGRSRSDRVKVVQAEAQSKRFPSHRSVHFKVVPWQVKKEPDPTLTIDVDRVGEELTIVLALKKCERRPFFGIF